MASEISDMAGDTAADGVRADASRSEAIEIALVDDDRNILTTVSIALQAEGFVTRLYSDGETALKALLDNPPDLAVFDIKMPKMDGMDALERIQLLAPDTPVVMISGHANIDTAVDAVKKGAFDFISKPPDLNRMLITLRNAMDKSSLISETKVLRKKVSKSKTQEIIGESPAIAKVKEDIEKVAPTDARVLVIGPNGSGKELVARWIHQKSHRSTNPIIEVNCAAIPSELIESELFGHEKGSFTGAHKNRVGKFEQANGGWRIWR